MDKKKKKKDKTRKNTKCTPKLRFLHRKPCRGELVVFKGGGLVFCTNFQDGFSQCK